MALPGMWIHPCCPNSYSRRVREFHYVREAYRGSPNNEQFKCRLEVLWSGFGGVNTPNFLYFGDCLEVMQNYLEDESVDLIYLDPPFNSKRIYNACMSKGYKNQQKAAQWVAFEDTWKWHEAVDDFDAVARRVSTANTMEGLKKLLGTGSNLAYLSYMANRLLECQRVLKDTGSIYLHCDPKMSHYLKVVMDGIFGPENFRNECVWAYRTGGTSNRWWARKHDTIFMYSKGEKWTFNRQTEKSYLSHKYGYSNVEILEDEKGLYRTVQCRDWWLVDALRGNQLEHLGYPTQKPVALLDRIIKASSNEGDIVLDPFCGCGTTLHAAQMNYRSWVGIDVSVTACKVIEDRFVEHFDSVWNDTRFLGMPKTVEQAKVLAAEDKFIFEKWAASLVEGIEANTKQRGDGGIDGRGRIAIRKGHFIDLVSQIKGGRTGPGDVQAFNGARQQEGADLGIFTCFEEFVSSGMKDAAANAGRFMGVPVIQIYTIEDFFQGRRPELPRPKVT